MQLDQVFEHGAFRMKRLRIMPAICACHALAGGKSGHGSP
jgi:hypothetical protein